MNPTQATETWMSDKRGRIVVMEWKVCAGFAVHLQIHFNGFINVFCHHWCLIELLGLPARGGSEEWRSKSGWSAASCPSQENFGPSCCGCWGTAAGGCCTSARSQAPSGFRCWDPCRSRVIDAFVSVHARSQSQNCSIWCFTHPVLAKLVQ